jgi:hypothetical protein
VRVIAIDPKTPTTLYVGTNGGGVFRSTTSAASWIRSNSGLQDLFVRSLVLHPQTPATVYAGTRRGVFKSTSGAGAWSTSSTGLP